MIRDHPRFKLAEQLNVDKICQDFVEAGQRLKEASEELTMAASILAGCDLSDWTVDDIIKYVKLALIEYKEEEM